MVQTVVHKCTAHSIYATRSVHGARLVPLTVRMCVVHSRRGRPRRPARAPPPRQRPARAPPPRQRLARWASSAHSPPLPTYRARDVASSRIPLPTYPKPPAATLPYPPRDPNPEEGRSEKLRKRGTRAPRQLARRRPLGSQLGFVTNVTKHSAWCEFPTNGDATEPTQRSTLSRGVHPITSRCARANSISRRRRVQQTSFFQHPSGGA